MGQITIVKAIWSQFSRCVTFSTVFSFPGHDHGLVQAQEVQGKNHATLVPVTLERVSVTRSIAGATQRQ